MFAPLSSIHFGRRIGLAFAAFMTLSSIVQAEIETSAIQSHFILGPQSILAVDLSHGMNEAALNLVRVWTGGSNRAGRFGPGWSDEHDVRLVQLSSELPALFRAGALVSLPYKLEDEWKTADGATVRKTTAGWDWSQANGRTESFDAAGRIVTRKFPSGRAVQYVYDAQGRLTQIAVGPGNELRFSYNESGLVRLVEGPEGLQATYEYDADRLIAVTDQRRIRIEYRYDEAGRLVSAADMFGRRTDFGAAMNSAAGVAPEATAETNPPSSPAMQPFICRVRDEDGRITSLEIGGEKTGIGYDSYERPLFAQQGTEHVTFEYDAFDRIIAASERSGQSIRFSYNRFGQPSEIRLHDGTWGRYMHDPHGRLVSWQKSTGEWGEFEYDAAGRIGKYRPRPEAEIRPEYDSRNRIAGLKYSDGDGVRYVYDDRERIVGITWAGGESRSYRYDERGALAEVGSSTGATVRYHADPKTGRLSSVEDSVHGRFNLSPKADGNDWNLNWEEVGVWEFSMLDGVAPRSVQTPAGRTWRYEYDSHGRVVAAVTPRQATVRYAYDSDGRWSDAYLPGRGKLRLEYDSAGRLSRIHRGDVFWREYVYDSFGRLRMESSPGGIAAVYAYDADGRTAEIVLPDGKTTYRYDRFGGIAKVEGPNYRIEQEYHADGSLARRAYQPSGLDLRFPKDEFGRSGGVTLNQTSVRYRYDAQGRLSRLELPDDLVLDVASDAAGRPTRITFGNATALTLGFDRADRATLVEAVDERNSSLFRETYEYDLAGNLVSLRETAQESRFEYDADNRLMRSVGPTTNVDYEYDEDGNLLAAESKDAPLRWELDSLGRPLREGTTKFFGYDPAGNLASERSLDVSADNEFDAAGRLVRRTVGGAAWQFGYLPNGDRLWKVGAQGLTWYVYLSGGPAAFKDPDGIAWLVVYLPGSDKPLALCGSDGRVLFVVADRLNSVRRVLDARGNIVARYDYNPYGKRVAATGKSPLVSFAGMLVDDHGWYYARNRYFDPNTGRFVSIDPVVGEPGDLLSHQAYAYAAANPLRYRDAAGLSPAVVPGTSLTSFTSRFDDASGNPFHDPTTLLETHQIRRFSNFMTAVQGGETPSGGGPSDWHRLGLGHGEGGTLLAAPGPFVIRRVNIPLPNEPLPFVTENVPSQPNPPPLPAAAGPVPAGPATGNLPNSNTQANILTEGRIIPPNPGSNAVGPTPPSQPSGNLPNSNTQSNILTEGRLVSPNPGRNRIPQGNIDTLAVPRPSRPPRLGSATAAFPRVPQPLQPGAGGRVLPRLSTRPMGWEQIAFIIYETYQNYGEVRNIYNSLSNPPINQQNQEENLWSVAKIFSSAGPAHLGAVIDILRMGTEAARAGWAVSEVYANTEHGRFVRAKMASTLVEIATDFPKRVIPLGSDGKTVSHARLVEMLQSNLVRGRPPFEGLITEDPTATSEEAFDEARWKALRIIEQKRVQNSLISRSYEILLNYERHIRSLLHRINLVISDALIRELNAAVADLFRLEREMAQIAAADPATWKEIAYRVEVDRMTICSYAERCSGAGTGGQPSAEQVATWRTESNALIRRMALAIESKRGANSPAQKISDALREKSAHVRDLLPRLRQAKRQVELSRQLWTQPYRSASGTYPPLTAMVTEYPMQVERLRSEFPDNIDDSLITEEVKNVLNPYYSNANPAVIPLILEAEKADAETLSLRHIMNHDFYDADIARKQIEEFEKKYASYLALATESESRAEEALRNFEKLPSSQAAVAAGVSNAITSGAGDDLLRALRALQGALECYSRIKHPGQSPATEPKPPTPSIVGAPPFLPTIPAGPETTVVPDVRKLSPAEAKEKVVAAKLKPQFHLGLFSSSKEQAGKVYFQEPDPGTKLPIGETLAITFYAGASEGVGNTAVNFGIGPSDPAKTPSLPLPAQPPAEPSALREVPKLIGLTAQEARDRLTGVGLLPESAPGQAAPAVDQTWKTYEQFPEAGVKVSPGTVVRFKVYSNAQDTASAPVAKPVVPPIPIPAVPTKPTTLNGNWTCSCGETWTLRQTGNRVSGQEGNAGDMRRIDGTFDGHTLRFTWQNTKGEAGTGVMVADEKLTVMNWRMTLNSTGQSWDGSAKRVP